MSDFYTCDHKWELDHVVEFVPEAKDHYVEFNVCTNCNAIQKVEVTLPAPIPDQLLLGNNRTCWPAPNWYALLPQTDVKLNPGANRMIIGPWCKDQGYPVEYLNIIVNRPIAGDCDGYLVVIPARCPEWQRRAVINAYLSRLETNYPYGFHGWDIEDLRQEQDAILRPKTPQDFLRKRIFEAGDPKDFFLPDDEHSEFMKKLKGVIDWGMVVPYTAEYFVFHSCHVWPESLRETVEKSKAN